MSVLLIGGCGSIGKRYAAILKHLNQPFSICDPKEPTTPDIQAFDRWIIASPTDTHIDWCIKAIELKKTFLCEKPISKNLTECKAIKRMADDNNVKGALVCNYKYVLNNNMRYRVHGSANLSYDYFNPGDQLEWACSQLIYLDPSVSLKSNSPKWEFRINRPSIDYEILEKSYISMIKDFIDGNYGKLWDLEDGIKLTEAVLKRLNNGISSKKIS